KRPRRINSVALNPSREEVAFTDRAAVYVKSAGKLPKALPSGRSDGASHPAQPNFNQVLFQSPNVIIASGVEPLLTVW
ncbi:hypothetical protein NQ331_26665, partial [Escherichia coli]|nr:hypothetical protein [Escherichia coli]